MLNNELSFQPFDIVEFDSHVGIVLKVQDEQASIEWFDKNVSLKSAWWSVEEVKIINNLSTIIASNLHGSFYSDKYQYNVKFIRKDVK